MNCSCPCSLTPQKQQLGPFRLNFGRCPICGRCDGWILLVEEKKTMTGNEARREYNRLEAQHTMITPKRKSYSKPKPRPIARGTSWEVMPDAEPTQLVQDRHTIGNTHPCAHGETPLLPPAELAHSATIHGLAAPTADTPRN